MPRTLFNEFEAFAEAVQDASVSMRIPSLEEPKWMLHYATIGSIRIQQGFEGGGNIAEGSALADGWAFFHQVSPSRPGLANGQVLTEDEVFAVPPNREFCLACQPSHDWTTVFVPTSLLFPTPIELEPARRPRGYEAHRPKLARPLENKRETGSYYTVGVLQGLASFSTF